MVKSGLAAIRLALLIALVVVRWAGDARAQITPTIHPASPQSINVPANRDAGATQMIDNAGNVIGTTANPVYANPPPGRSLGYCQLSVGASAVALSTCSGGIPAGTILVNLTISGTNIRYRDDGTNPTAGIGIPILQSQNFSYSSTNLVALVFIAQSGTASLDIGFYGR